MLASAALTILLAGGCASSQDREDAEESRQSRNTQETDGGDRSGLLIPPAELRGAYPHPFAKCFGKITGAAPPNPTDRAADKASGCFESMASQNHFRTEIQSTAAWDGRAGTGSRIPVRHPKSQNASALN